MERASSRFARWAAISIAAFLSSGVVACDAERAKEKSELERLSFALERVREAKPLERARALDALDAFSCDATCELRAECARAYRRDFDVRTRLAAMRRAMTAAGVPSEPEASEVGRRLDEIDGVERDLRAAQLGVTSCLDHEFEARRRLELGRDAPRGTSARGE